MQLPKIITELPKIDSKTGLEHDRIDIDMKRLVAKICSNKFDDNTDTQTQHSYMHDIIPIRERTLTSIITCTFYALNILYSLLFSL